MDSPQMFRNYSLMLNI